MQGIYVYTLGIFLAAILAWAAKKFSKKSKKGLNRFFWIASISILTIIFGFRKIGIGVDDYTYLKIFNNVARIGPINQFLNTTMEPGYLILNYIISIFTDDFQVVIFITTLIPLILYYKAIEREKENINLFLAVFLFGMIMCIYFCGIIRLFIATSIVAYAIRYVFEKKTYKFIFMVLLASTFHYSAIFMLVLIYFSTEQEDKTRSNKWLIFIIMFLLPMLIYIVSNYIFPNMGERYSQYTEIKTGTIAFDMLDKLPFLVLIMFFYPKLNEKNKNIRIYVTMYIISLVISLYSVWLDIGRIQWYTNFSICIIFSSIDRIMLKTKMKEMIYIYILLMIIYGVLYGNKIVNEGSRKCMKEYNIAIYDR